MKPFRYHLFGLRQLVSFATELLATAQQELRKTWPDLRTSFVQNTSQAFYNDTFVASLAEWPIRRTPLAKV